MSTINDIKKMVTRATEAMEDGIITGLQYQAVIKRADGMLAVGGWTWADLGLSRPETG